MTAVDDAGRLDLDAVEAGARQWITSMGPYLRADVTLALVAELRAAREAEARVREVLSPLAAVGWDHTGGPDCMGCWVRVIRAALAAMDGTS